MPEINNAFVSLKGDYNAVGDGVTDDTKAINAFLDYLAENGGTGIIEPGIYLLKSYRKSTNTKPFTLTGSTADSTIFRSTSQATFFQWTQCTGIHIKNITFDCQYENLPPISGLKHGLIFISCTNCSVENGIVDDFLGTGLMAYTQSDTDSPRSSHITFNNCRAKATPAFNDWLKADDDVKKSKECNGIILVDSDYCTISNCNVEDISLFGVELKNLSRWNKIINCRAINCVYGFGMGQQTTDDTGCEHNIVSNFQATLCYIGCILGKSTSNLLSNFIIDFTDQDENTVRNAVRVQLNSKNNSLNNFLITGIPSNISAIRFESGSSNNVCTVALCESTNSGLIISEYINSDGYTETLNNYTVLYQSSTDRSKIESNGNATGNNKTRFEWDQSDIT